MIAQTISVVDFARHLYGIERDISPASLEQVVIAARLFEQHVGQRVPIASLDETAVSHWVIALQASARATRTVKGKRSAILSLWRYAAEIGYHDREPNARRVRQARVTQPPPRCWTIDQVRSLLAAAATPPKKYRRPGIRQADWWEAFIRLAWDTGLRLGDLLALTRADVRPSGVVVITQHKTGLSHVTPPLWPETVQAIGRTIYRDALLPWMYRRRRLYADMRALRKLAGITSGTSKWLRRASATYYARDNGGSATVHLGHRSPGLDRRAYIDPTIADAARPRVPRLG